jgi:hypothetical protein
MHGSVIVCAMRNRKSTFRGLKPHQRIGIAIAFLIGALVILMAIKTGPRN